VLLLAGAMAAVLPDLQAVYDQGVAGAVSGSTASAAGRTLLLAAVISALAWGVLTYGLARLGERSPGAFARGRAVWAAALVLALAGAGGAAVLNASQVRNEVHQQYNAFVNLGFGSGGEATSSRLVSGGGKRYDYWRIAFATWRQHKIVGTGAAGYPISYFKQRRTTEDVRQPHSLGLQTLTELGIAGAGLLFAALLALMAGAARAVRRARTAAEVGVTTAAIGILSVWTVHTSVDWIHLLPGLTGIAIIAAAALLRGGRSEPAATDADRARGRRVSLAATVGIAALLAAGGISLSRQVLTDRYVASADAALAHSPGTALRNADEALRLDRTDIEASYVKAAAVARSGDGDGARAVLLEALRHEPDNFVTFTLLGDLAVRQGDFREARRRYGRAHELNPRDPGLTALAGDPRSAITP
jgi:hypothetical protein